MINELERQGYKITIALLVSQSLFAASSIMGFTVASIIILELADGNSQWAGVPGTLNMVGAALMAYPIGRFMDVAGRRIGLSVGYILGIVGALLTLVAVLNESLWLFLVGILFIGFTKGAIDQGRYAAAEANSIQRQARALSLVVLGGTVGSIFGPALIKQSGALAEWLNWPSLSGVWLLIIIFFGVALVVINLFLRPDPQAIAKELAKLNPITKNDNLTENLVLNPVRSFWEVAQNSAVQVAVAALVVGQLVMVLIMAITPAYMHLNHHDIGAVSIVIMAHTLGMFGLSFVTGYLVDRVGRERMIVLGCVVLIVACLIAPLSTAVLWLSCGLFLLGLGWNFCYVAGSALLGGVLQAGEKGRVQGIVDTLVSLSSAVGMLGSGFVFNALGFRWMNSGAIVVAILPIVVMGVVAKSYNIKKV